MKHQHLFLLFFVITATNSVSLCSAQDNNNDPVQNPPRPLQRTYAFHQTRTANRITMINNRLAVTPGGPAAPVVNLPLAEHQEHPAGHNPANNA